MKPPGWAERWEDCSPQAKLDILNFDEVITNDEQKRAIDLAQIAAGIR